MTESKIGVRPDTFKVRAANSGTDGGGSGQTLSRAEVTALVDAQRVRDEAVRALGARCGIAYTRPGLRIPLQPNK